MRAAGAHAHSCSAPFAQLSGCLHAPEIPPSVSLAIPRSPTERTGKLTYAAVVGHECGPGWGVAVRASIIIGSAGFLVLYLIILGDLLVGECAKLGG